MSYIPQAPRLSAVMTPPARMVEPHLDQPIRRPGLVQEPTFGCILLLERHQTGEVWEAIVEVAKAWPRSADLLKHDQIVHPLQKLPEAAAAQFGDAYRGGFMFRAETPVRPPLFHKVTGLDYRGKLLPGAEIECAIGLFATINQRGERAIGTEIEWIDVHVAEATLNYRWLTVCGCHETDQKSRILAQL